MPLYYHAKSGGNWTTNKGETEGGIVPPSLNRVKVHMKRNFLFHMKESKPFTDS